MGRLYLAVMSGENRSIEKRNYFEFLLAAFYHTSLFNCGFCSFEVSDRNVVFGPIVFCSADIRRAWIS